MALPLNTSLPQSAAGRVLVNRQTAPHQGKQSPSPAVILSRLYGSPGSHFGHPEKRPEQCSHIDENVCCTKDTTKRYSPPPLKKKKQKTDNQEKSRIHLGSFKSNDFFFFKIYYFLKGHD